MGCFDDCLSGMLEPYGGNMPLFKGDTTDATVTIIKESYDDGMSVTRIQTPPRTPTCKLVEAINNVLGMMGGSDSLLGGLCKDEDKKDKKDICPECGKDPCVCEGGEEDDIRPESESESSEKPDWNKLKKQGGSR